MNPEQLSERLSHFLKYRVSWLDKEGVEIPVEEAERLLTDLDYRRVALYEKDGYTVSTVWLGLDHNLSDEGPPMIFETMVFTEHPNFFGSDTWRWSTLAEAEAGHEMVVGLIENGTRKPDILFPGGE